MLAVDVGMLRIAISVLEGRRYQRGGPYSNGPAKDLIKSQGLNKEGL